MNKEQLIKERSDLATALRNGHITVNEYSGIYNSLSQRIKRYELESEQKISDLKIQLDYFQNTCNYAKAQETFLELRKAQNN